MFPLPSEDAVPSGASIRGCAEVAAFAASEVPASALGDSAMCSSSFAGEPSCSLVDAASLAMHNIVCSEQHGLWSGSLPLRKWNLEHIQLAVISRDRSSCSAFLIATVLSGRPLLVLSPLHRVDRYESRFVGCIIAALKMGLCSAGA